MKRNSTNWLTYWDDADDLKYLENALDNISQVYEEIKSSIGRTLMSEEMLEIQESLETRIEELEKSTEDSKKAA
ncbi:hypothetical protein GF337_04230 [candidate division KSB1 bacterium]|nr:hypothetical protein [candidate division KSB1 bacterium]